MGLLKSLFNKRNNNLENQILNLPDAEISKLPKYLIYPQNLDSKAKAISNQKCGYQLMLDNELANTTPEVKKNQPAFDCNETHIYWKTNLPYFVSVTTMKTPSVKTSNLKGWVESQDKMGQMFGSMISFLNLPSKMNFGEYTRVQMIYLGQSETYNKLHSFEETHVYCHIFYLGNQLYKKFILCAKRGITSWKVECTIPTEPNAVPTQNIELPGMIFGSFFKAMNK